ncbi:MAG: glycoside hydrolase family 32 protein [Tessaracoccus sp.]|uniref:glycoside hydrolase family 32 protein n=1 Tax=Tessaracoccus sp. TaxID=1971211 RepID=UPI001EC197A9|nr:glycoside hydrolase family 32 protein [Tessaracoccus sp.]MBK7820212.1 glycoside hydrolase family 32 protein [Tessaracoccus sp.]
MTFDPALRPRAHFAPRRNWMNDPNGLLFHDGEYHLYFQHNSRGWWPGFSSWGHAVSRDLVEWTELAVAIPSTDDEFILSGSAVVDHRNVSGLGTPEGPALVAIYTSFSPVTKIQRQSLAYSTDGGRTFTPYAGNPIIDIDSHDFRDPKLLRREDEFVMAIVMTQDRTVRLYESKNLLDWILSSEVGPFGFTEGVWECPDIVLVPIEGGDDAAWVLLLSVQSGGPAGGSGMQYLVVDYDGHTFTPIGEARWLDFGSDFYAGVAYTDAPAPVIHAWMNNWAYAANTPGEEFRGMMSLPRRLTLRRKGDDLVLVQRPVFREGPPLFEAHDVVVDGRHEFPNAEPAVRIVADFDAGTAARFGLDVRVGGDEATRVVVDRAAGTVSVDRTRSGLVRLARRRVPPESPDFEAAEAAAHLEPQDIGAAHPAPLAETDRVTLEVFVDVSSVEVLAADGAVAVSDLIFPSPESTGIVAFADGGVARLRSLTVSAL